MDGRSTIIVKGLYASRDYTLVTTTLIVFLNCVPSKTKSETLIYSSKLR